jgi:ferredoxin
MAYVVTENCIRCKHTDCVKVCPVDCFRETPLMLVIAPDECVDCGFCEPECPVGAIRSADDVPAAQHGLIDFNARQAQRSPAITRHKEPMPGAEIWKNIPGKTLFLELVEARTAPEASARREERYLEILEAEKLASGEVNDLLGDDDLMVRLLAASRRDFKPNRRQLLRGLSDPSELVRCAFVARGGAALTNQDVDALLGDSATSVRLELIRTHAERLSAAQVDRALCDVAEDVRLAAMRTKGFMPTEAQFFRALENGGATERRIMLSLIRPAFVPRARRHPSSDVRAVAYGFEAVPIRPTEVGAGLDDADAEVRHALARRCDFRPSPTEFAGLVSSGGLRMFSDLAGKANAACIEATLRLPDGKIVAAVVSELAEIDELQLGNLLADPRVDVSLAALKRLGRGLTGSQLALCLGSAHESLRRAALGMFATRRLRGKLLSRALRDRSSAVRSLAVGMAGASLSAKQLQAALGDRAANVRLAVASRADFLPSLGQFKQGRADASVKVRELFAARFKVSGGKVVARSAERGRLSPPRAADRLRKLLQEMGRIPTWTARKRLMKSELEALLQRLGYVRFKVDSRDAWFTGYGTHGEIYVPPGKRGHLRDLRGQKAHIVCLGAGRFSRTWFAAKAMR